MMVFASASDLLTLFVALEVFSLPLYLLSGMARRRRLLSQEAALKYFLLGAFSSAFMLFGIAMLYVFSGSFDLRVIHAAVGGAVGSPGLIFIGLAFIAVGLLFKTGVVPFHNWTPDVYMGAPTPVTGFMAICTKFAAVVALMRVFFVALDGMRWTWQPIFAVLATPRDTQFVSRLYLAVTLCAGYAVFQLTFLLIGFDFHTVQYAYMTMVIVAFVRDPVAQSAEEKASVGSETMKAA